MTQDPAGTGAPAWFARALAAAPEHRDVEVDGTRVHYRVWGPVGAPGLVLVHGGAAHSGWWDHVAPQLSSHRVVALDLSGHGDSGHREIYDMRQWAREIVTVCEAEALHRPVVVGHSMGGWVAVTTGVEHPDAVAAVAYIDSPLNDQPPEEARLAEMRRPRRPHPDLDEAVARFRTLPPQDVVLPYIGRYVARQSLRPVEGGWTWKFDPTFFGRRLLLRDLLPQLGCPVALFRCEHGLVSPEMAAEMGRLVPGTLPVVDLPDAGHHPMLDRPLALVTGLRTLLALWPAATAV
ncbi:alpha/beta fold hydrolase [Blastococcus sp. SYSU D00669]